ncbi:hypothetical protein Dsin_020435 [Dipteronia sinensis]|uniref:Reverse transcriptase zinc-binding domain-containing protein n=1 Tax=Dipteronia sinensis TaxID=43782 RepID=A0AAE0A9Z7_9ROSI|nr:hypothetical protein Dsin_020435 [Dipteronia sinensis]
MKDFRPISLVDSMYKILAKVLANRIKKVMNKVPLRQPSFARETKQWRCFSAVLAITQIRCSFEDKKAWLHNSSGVFSVASFRRSLECPLDNERMDSNFIWQRLCPPKVEIFAWHLFKGRVIVRKLLIRLGSSLVSDERCPICKDGEETLVSLSSFEQRFDATISTAVHPPYIQQVYNGFAPEGYHLCPACGSLYRFQRRTAVHPPYVQQVNISQT